MIISNGGDRSFTTTGTAFRSPWQNGIAERWVGSARRELLDHVIVLNEGHLRHLLSEYVDYYNAERVHTRLQDSPMDRPSTDRRRKPRLSDYPESADYIIPTRGRKRPDPCDPHLGGTNLLAPPDE